MKIISTVAEIRISYHPKSDLTKTPRIRESRDLYQIFRNSWDPDLIQYVEQFKVLLLTRANHVLGLVNISTGGTTATVADPRVIFGTALKANATGIALCHNHPSGCLKPSSDDLRLTEKIVEGARLFDMRVIDHLIISPETYLSMVDEGLL